MAGPAGKKMAQPRTTPAFPGIVQSHAASERASARRSPQAHAAGPVTKKLKNTPKGRGATVGDAVNVGIQLLHDSNRTVRDALKSSPGLRSKGIENVMKLPSRKR